MKKLLMSGMLICSAVHCSDDWKKPVVGAGLFVLSAHYNFISHHVCNSMHISRKKEEKENLFNLANTGDLEKIKDRLADCPKSVNSQSVLSSDNRVMAAPALYMRCEMFDVCKTLLQHGRPSRQTLQEVARVADNMAVKIDKFTKPGTENFATQERKLKSVREIYNLATVKERWFTSSGSGLFWKVFGTSGE